ncbi:hypothetical protein [Streptomyces sp. ALI-76-A]|uniref:hypothetical protein n=1 Tax=Streptomyces sp. ALI-76-A TaxID=3025736 RepID=UPI00256EB7ED|nr:hypothetical protein [Streptomyces sp. ALI-76-A]MDL5201492.1 hypothetical protein [Streptomyces sp. ALI-76-A]
MNEEQWQGRGAEGGDAGDFEEQVRELLAEDAYTIRPSPAPYPAIRRRGMAERRRRAVAAGAALVTLAAVPVGVYAVSGTGGGAHTAAATSSAGVTPAATPTPSPTPAGPAGPATPGQLLDGITLSRAADGLEECLAWDRKQARTRSIDLDLGAIDSYRIILAMNSTGDSNAIGDGVYIVAVQDKPGGLRLICTLKNEVADDEGPGINVSSDDRLPDSPPVLADVNGGKLFQQSAIDKGNWKLPFRWGLIGTVTPSVAKVTVSYGDATSEAVLDHGWFVATGILNQQVTVAPRIKGYDAGGTLLYDSDQDESYHRTVP